MSKHYEQVKKYYQKGLWSLERVRNAVVKGWITEPEFYLIAQMDYSDIH